MEQFWSNVGENQKIIVDWFNAYYQSGVTFFLGLFAWGYLFYARKDLRRCFLIPIFIILLIIFNPIIYMYVYTKITYWRLFWMFPNVILISMAIVSFIEKSKYIWQRWILFTIVMLAIVFCGKNVFECIEFEKRDNWEKISQETIDVCGIILGVDDTPKVIVPDNLLCEVRQYAPQIEMKYGRNAHAYIGTLDPSIHVFYYFLNEPEVNYFIIGPYLQENAIEFFVVDKELDPIILAEYGYIEIARTSKSIIYYNGEM